MMFFSFLLVAETTLHIFEIWYRKTFVSHIDEKCVLFILYRMNRIVANLSLTYTHLSFTRSTLGSLVRNVFLPVYPSPRTLYWRNQNQQWRINVGLRSIWEDSGECQGCEGLEPIRGRWFNSGWHAQVLMPTNVAWCQGSEGRLTEHRSRIENNTVVMRVSHLMQVFLLLISLGPAMNVSGL